MKACACSVRIVTDFNQYDRAVQCRVNCLPDVLVSPRLQRCWQHITEETVLFPNYSGRKIPDGEKFLSAAMEKLYSKSGETFESRDDVLTLLVHLGYLAYDQKSDEVFIPNVEIQAEFVRAVKGCSWNEVIYSKNVF